jgi:hypothetical protein
MSITDPGRAAGASRPGGEDQRSHIRLTEKVKAAG